MHPKFLINMRVSRTWLIMLTEIEHMVNMIEYTKWTLNDDTNLRNQQGSNKV